MKPADLLRDPLSVFLMGMTAVLALLILWAMATDFPVPNAIIWAVVLVVIVNSMASIIRIGQEAEL